MGGSNRPYFMFINYYKKKIKNSFDFLRGREKTRENWSESEIGLFVDVCGQDRRQGVQPVNL